MELLRPGRFDFGDHLRHFNFGQFRCFDLIQACSMPTGASLAVQACVNSMLQKPRVFVPLGPQAFLFENCSLCSWCCWNVFIQHKVLVLIAHGFNNIIYHNMWFLLAC